jgi:hypothetical protein
MKKLALIPTFSPEDAPNWGGEAPQTTCIFWFSELTLVNDLLIKPKIFDASEPGAPPGFF